MINLPDSEKLRILLAPAVGDNIGFGHVARLARLGARILEGGGFRVAWAVRDAQRWNDFLATWLGVPVLELSDTLPHHGIVFDGIDPAEGGARAAYRSMFAVAGEMGEVAHVVRANGQAIFLQGPTLAVPSDERVLPAVFQGGPWVLVEPAHNALKSRGWTLVSFGGSEQGRVLTLAVIGMHEALVRSPRDHFLAGQSLKVVWPWGDVPPDLHRNADYLKDVRNLSAQIGFVDTVIGAFGMTTWEALAQGVPGAYVSWTARHALGYEDLIDGVTVSDLGRPTGLTPEILAARVRTLIDPIFRTNAFSAQYRKLALDGLGVIRVAHKIKSVVRANTRHDAGQGKTS